MRWLSRVYHMAVLAAVAALLGATALTLASGLAGRGFLFTGGFSPSSQPLTYERLITRAPPQATSVAEVAAPTPTPSPAPTPTASPVPGGGSELQGDQGTVSGGSEFQGDADAQSDGSPSPGSANAVSDSSQSQDGGETISDGLRPASLQVIERSTNSKGATTITWDSGFADFDYALGSTITMTVNWTVDAGAASYAGFDLKRYTPPDSDKEPAAGTTPQVIYPGSNGPNSVDVSFAFTALHMDWEREPPTEIGNAHFKLYLRVDANGDGIPETLLGYGVNVHVEDPA